MNPYAIQHIVILGGGSAGWMTAAALSNALRGDCRISLVESDELGTLGVGEASIPPIKLFNRQLGISESEFLQKTQGTFKLGIQFVGWWKQGEHYFHPFGNYAANFDEIPLHQYWFRERQRSDPSLLMDYSMAWVLAKQAKFTMPISDSRNILSTFDYAYHFDANLYAALLRNYAEQRGVFRIEGKCTSIELNKESGNIDALVLESGNKISGEFFIDCSGFQGVLIQKALGVAYCDWQQWLPCDRAWAVASTPPADLLPYTRAVARTAGWQWQIPLQHRLGNGYVFSSHYLDTQVALDEFVEHLPTMPIADPKLLRFRVGCCATPWKKNCVAIGLSAGFLEPLESTSLHLIQTAIHRFLALFPDRRCHPLLAQEFNRVTCQEYEYIRDFLIAHYCLNQRAEPLWQQCASMSIPDSLQYKMDHFRAYGRFVASGLELFNNNNWLAIFNGQGMVPESYDPRVDQRPQVESQVRLAGLRKLMTETVAHMPRHQDFLAGFMRNNG